MEEMVKGLQNLFRTIELHWEKTRKDRIAQYTCHCESLLDKRLGLFPRKNQLAITARLTKVVKLIRDAKSELAEEIAKVSDIEGVFRDVEVQDQLGGSGKDGEALPDGGWDEDDGTEPMDETEKIAAGLVETAVASVEKVIYQAVRVLNVIELPVPTCGDDRDLQLYKLKVQVRTLEAFREEAENVAAAVDNIVSAAFAPQDLAEFDFRTNELAERMSILRKLLDNCLVGLEYGDVDDDEEGEGEEGGAEEKAEKEKERQRRAEERRSRDEERHKKMILLKEEASKKIEGCKFEECLAAIKEVTEEISRRQNMPTIAFQCPTPQP
uniref:Uncharacterized protein n=1 Tax=Chromera velia CCMP2878 TaxID=1169474 RepID=A0A0G4GPK2_9ALVE|eukprot:Cvel_22777.t1-p1 / transcript=Cvel_22777.t1 / gene=Cvel_22777 / organism=Chromera_velia_CCMP2878 / gene_product=hypothetical protein / transcript_product=hypothetical protein / location=Cvel_scaffold2277:231-4825(+) / protein_length=324 / sequence_SO=supercontig / SO=protein_coding / is_pseudo=false